MARAQSELEATLGLAAVNELHRHIDNAQNLLTPLIERNTHAFED